MDSQYSDNILEFDKTFSHLLEVEGGFFKRIKFRKCVKRAKEFYVAYVKKCNEYNEYIDFFEPLFGYLISCGFGYDKSLEYLSEIRERILKYLNSTISSEFTKEKTQIGEGG